MEKTFEISAASLDLKNTSYEEFKNVFSAEKTKIEKFLNENFDNPDRISYLDFKIDYGQIVRPYGQTLYLNKDDKQYEKAYNLLKKSPNFDKVIGYRIYIREPRMDKDNPRKLSYISFGTIKFLFDESLMNELEEKDRELARNISRFYSNSNSNYTGD